jgi:hypothetical protein
MNSLQLSVKHVSSVSDLSSSRQASEGLQPDLASRLQL